MIRRSRPPQPERRHRAARRWSAGAVALGGILVLAGLVVVLGLAGGTGRFTPLPLPQTGASGAGTDRSPTAGRQTSPPDPRTSSASSSPATGAPTATTSPTTAAAHSPSPGPVGQQRTPYSAPSALDTSVKHPPHHGKPTWSGGGPHDVKPDVSP